MFRSAMAVFIGSVYAQTLPSCDDGDCVEVPEPQQTVLLQQKHSLALDSARVHSVREATCPENFPVCLQRFDCATSECANGCDQWVLDTNYISGYDGQGAPCTGDYVGITTTQVTETTTSCDGTSCQIWGDPHVSGFDNSGHYFPGYLALLSFGAGEGPTVPIDVNVYEDGDFWLVRNAELKIQGRFAQSKDFVPKEHLPAMSALAISGPLLENKLLHVQSLDMAVSWDGQQLNEAPFDKNMTSGSLHIHSHEGPEGARVLEVQLPKGLHLRAVRFPKHIDAAITLPKSFIGEVDGLCGNRNGVADDDAQEIVNDRMHGITVSPHERLLPM